MRVGPPLEERIPVRSAGRYFLQLDYRYNHQFIYKLYDGFKKCNKPIKDSNILILGVSYKPDVKDVQLSPAEVIINKLNALGAKIKIYDPYYKGNKIFGINVEHNIQDILSEIDASIIVTAHKEFQEINPKIFTKMKTPILIDTRGIIDTCSAIDAGLVFRGLGRAV